jgi:hypothetical protein
MDKRAKQIRNKAEYRLAQIAKLREQVAQIERELVLLEVEYEEITIDQPLLTPDRKRVVAQA